MASPPWKLPASDPIDGPLGQVCDQMRRVIAVGQQWAIGEGCAFEIKTIGAYDAFGVLRSYDDAGCVRWEREHFLWFGYFAGRMRDQERRPVRWFPGDDSTDQTAARTRRIEID